MLSEGSFGLGVSLHLGCRLEVRANVSCRASAIQQAGNYANAKDFYDYLLNRIMVKFQPRFPKNVDSEVFELPLNKKMSYDQFAAKVGEALGADPTHIRFTTVNATTQKSKTTVRRNPNLNLYQILHPQFTSYSPHQRNDVLCYEVLDISLSELDTKKSMRLVWVTEGLTKEVGPRVFLEAKISLIAL